MESEIAQAEPRRKEQDNPHNVVLSARVMARKSRCSRENCSFGVVAQTAKCPACTVIHEALDGKMSGMLVE